jgi:hypothetical protein
MLCRKRWKIVNCEYIWKMCKDLEGDSCGLFEAVTPVSIRAERLEYHEDTSRDTRESSRDSNREPPVSIRVLLCDSLRCKFARYEDFCGNVAGLFQLACWLYRIAQVYHHPPPPSWNASTWFCEVRGRSYWVTSVAKLIVGGQTCHVSL